MASEMTTHTCGHTSKLHGSRKDLEWRVRRAEAESCWDCRKSAENLAAAQAAEAQGLPALQGSDKQIDWAGTIRQKLLRSFDELMKEGAGRLETHPDTADLVQELVVIRALYREVAQQTSAKHFIERGQKSARDYCADQIDRRPELTTEWALTATAELQAALAALVALASWQPTPEPPQGGPHCSRRTWADAQKAQIVAEYDAAPHGSKGSVALAQGIHRNYITRWRRSLRLATLASRKAA